MHRVTNVKAENISVSFVFFAFPISVSVPLCLCGLNSADGAFQRFAVCAPAVVADGAFARGGAESRPQRRIGQSLQRIGQARNRRRGLIEQPFDASFHEPRDPVGSGATIGSPAAMYSKIFSGDQ